MNNTISEGCRVTVTAGATLTSGQLAKIGHSLLGLPNTDATSGDAVAIDLEGEYLVPKVSAAITGEIHLAGESISAGDDLFLDLDNDVLTKKPIGPFIGVATAAAGTSDANVRVRLQQMGGNGSRWICAVLDGNGGLSVGSHSLVGGAFPAGAAPLRYGYKVLRNNFTSPTSDGATIALGHSDDVDALKAATAISSGSTWDATGTPVFAAAATPTVTTQERSIQATVAVEATSDTDSVLVVWAEYLVLGSFA